MTQVVDRNGKSRNYAFDDRGLLVGETWTSGASTIYSASWTYDSIGRLVNASDNSSAYAYTYDELSRVTSVDNAGSAGMPHVVYEYAYDAVGNLLEMTEKIGDQVKAVNTYAYDAADRTIRITQTGASTETKRVDFAYNALGQYTEISRYADSAGNSLVATSSYTYDILSRLTGIEHASTAGTINSYQYSFDSLHRITQITSIDGTSTYDYDETSQLTGADHDAIDNEAYTYDSTGNRTSGDTVTSENNRLLFDGHLVYQYDRNGNRIEARDAFTGDRTTYTWDGHDRLTRVQHRDALDVLLDSAEYTYDVSNRRIQKKVDTDGDGDFDTVEKYLYDQTGSPIAYVGTSETPLDNQTLVFNGSNQVEHRYLHGPSVDQVLADEYFGSSDGVDWLLADHQGSVRDVVDNTGAVRTHIIYDAFGNLIDSSNPIIEVRWAFTGREFDAETGHYYYRARYYDATNGKFLSEDPIGFGAGDANLARYVGNSTLNQWDPSGAESVGHHAGTLSRVLKLYKEGLVDKDATLVATGAYSGPTTPPHNGRRQNGVSHYEYNEAVEGELRSFYKEKNKGKRKPTPISKDEMYEIIKNFEDGYGASDRKNKNPTIDKFNRGIRKEVKANKINPRKRTCDFSIDELMERGKKYAKRNKKRFKGELLAGVGLAILIDNASALADVANGNDNLNKGIEQLRRGNLPAAERFLFGGPAEGSQIDGFHLDYTSAGGEWALLSMDEFRRQYINARKEAEQIADDFCECNASWW